MRLHSKINLSLAVVFAILALTTAIVTFRYQSDHAVKAAENRVRLYSKAAWEIYDSRLERIQGTVTALAGDPRLASLLTEQRGEGSPLLDRLRAEHGMDVLTLVDARALVVARGRAPYRAGDDLSWDPLVRRALAGQRALGGTVVMEPGQLDQEGSGLKESCRQAGGSESGMVMGAAAPIRAGQRVVGAVRLGHLLNGAVDKVDRIRDALFENEQYRGRPVGTATIFMGDLRISTNVLDGGQRAIGTRASEGVSERVLRDGRSWTGRAWVVNAWYLSQYDPIRDPDGRVIGMLYLGTLEQLYLDQRSMAVAVNSAVVVGGMLLSMTVLYLVLRATILVPLRRLHLATQRLSAGDLGHRVEVGSRDELGELSLSFNRMAAQLRKDQEEIEGSRKELADRNEELETANRHYMDMLGFVSHELKAPLGSAILGLHSVKGGYLGPVTEPQERTLKNVALSLDYLHEMVKHYLDLSRLEKGELRLRKVWVTLRSEVVEPLVEGLSAALDGKSMRVEQRLAPSLRVYADPDQLKIVYDNLLSNAIKYGREGGWIRLGAELTAGMIRLSVENEGEGIPRDQTNRLFRKFSRLATIEETGQKGTGLGLYICRAIVEAHGGEMLAESAEGEWARFTFTLPLQGEECGKSEEDHEEEEDPGHR
jgi:two-component system, NtrC family, sensor kinase